MSTNSFGKAVPTLLEAAKAHADAIAESAAALQALHQADKSEPIDLDAMNTLVRNLIKDAWAYKGTLTGLGNLIARSQVKSKPSPIKTKRKHE